MYAFTLEKRLELFSTAKLPQPKLKSDQLKLKQNEEKNFNECRNYTLQIRRTALALTNAKQTYTSDTDGSGKTNRK